jgi:hypothetical protein
MRISSVASGKSFTIGLSKSVDPRISPLPPDFAIFIPAAAVQAMITMIAHDPSLKKS